MARNIDLLRAGLAPICRRLPPVLAYRLYYRFLMPLEGSSHEFSDARAMFGSARLSGTMADVVDAHFACHGTAEFLGITLASLLLHPSDTVFEVGANLGTETLNLAGIVGAAGRVVAMEPHPQTLARLKERISSNRLHQVLLLAVAASDREGTATLQPGPKSNSGMAFVGTGGTPGGAEIRTTTLDRVAQEHGKPALIWMDIEGYEHSALKGASRVLADARPFVYTEVDRGHLERAGSSLPEFVDFIREAGYVALDPTRWGLEEVRVDPGTREYFHENWLLVPGEKRRIVDAIRARFMARKVLPRW